MQLYLKYFDFWFIILIMDLIISSEIKKIVHGSNYCRLYQLLLLLSFTLKVAFHNHIFIILISSQYHVLNHRSFWIVIFIITIINYYQNKNKASCLIGAVSIEISVNNHYDHLFAILIIKFSYIIYNHKSFPSYSLVTIINIYSSLNQYNHHQRLSTLRFRYKKAFHSQISIMKKISTET